MKQYIRPIIKYFLITILFLPSLYGMKKNKYPEKGYNDPRKKFIPVPVNYSTLNNSTATPIEYSKPTPPVTQEKTKEENHHYEAQPPILPPVPMKGSFIPNKELEAAVSNYNKSKIEKILPTIPPFTKEECNYYQNILINKNFIYGFKPDSSIAQQLFFPTLIGTQSLAILTYILGMNSMTLKSKINKSKINLDRLSALKTIYYSFLLLTGISAIGTIALPATFTFHTYYSSKKEDLFTLLGKHLTSNN